MLKVIYLFDKDFYDLKLVVNSIEHWNDTAHSGTVARNVQSIKNILHNAKEGKLIDERRDVIGEG